MTDDERARQARLVFAPDRAAFAVTRALVRTALSRYAPVAPGDWRFAPGPHGRPHVVAPAGADLPQFSVSHTSGLIACLITRDAEAGVDVERLRALDDAIAIAESHFAPTEVSALRACRDENERQSLFFALWTLKEAFLKALGQGLTLPLEAAVFSLGPGITARLDPSHVAPGRRWDFQLWRPSPEHRLALARATAGDAPPAPLSFFRVVPFEWPIVSARHPLWPMDSRSGTLNERRP
jgi:4'-phosphopantetheinyl transferase